MDIKRVSQNDSTFPVLVRHIPDAPKELYYRGDISIADTLCIAVVGARAMTPYGKDVAGHLARELARMGCTVVSGLALGIDAVAHRGALEGNGRTIAVLGSGVDDASIGPATNIPLAHDILAQGGLILSEYAPGTRATNFTFPARNRIVSGLSRGTVIVEAAQHSGALITARCALEQGRDVFAVPGSIFSPKSVGTHMLIRNGAKPIAGVKDILEEYADADEHTATTRSANLSVSEQAIISILNNAPCMLDEIVTASDMEAPEILASLSMLELQGVIVHGEDGTYRLAS